MLTYYGKSWNIVVENEPLIWANFVPTIKDDENGRFYHGVYC